MEKYTFNDWLNDNANYSEVSKKRLNEGIRVDFNEIHKAQDQVFKNAVEMRIQADKRKIKNEPREWKEVELKRIKSWIDNRPRIEHKYIKKKIDRKEITGKRYQAMMARYKDFEQGKDATGTIIETTKEGDIKVSELFMMYVYKDGVLEYLESLVSDNEPDSELKEIIKLAIDGNKVQKKNKKHASEFMGAYYSLKKESPNLGISSYIRKIGMADVESNTYRDWIEKFDKAQLLLNAK